VRLHQDHTEGCVCILARMQVVPTAQSYLPPALILQFDDCRWFTPRLRLFERESASVDARTSSATIWTWRPV
jgi:hypothetical protein